MNKELYDKRKERLGAISVEIAKCNAGLARVSDAQLGDIAKELVSLTQQRDTLVAALRAMREQERQEAEAEKAAAEQAEASRKQEVFEKIKSDIEAGRIVCQACGSSPVKLAGEDPEFLSPGWRTQDTRGENWRKWGVPIACTNRRCGFRARIFPDQPSTTPGRKSRKQVTVV